MARVAVNIISTELRNYLINSNFDFWQRNTSFSSPATNTYTADRWVVTHDGTIGTFTVSRQAFTLGQTSVPGEPKYFLRWDHTVAGSGSTFRRISQRIEDVRTLAGKKATVSIWMKADSARTVGVLMRQNFGTGGSPSAEITTATQNISLTTSWQRFNLTFDIASISGKTLGSNNNDYLALELNLPINVTMTIDLAQSMIVEGSSPANFKLAGENLIRELALCERFYEKTYDLDVPPGTDVDTGIVSFGRRNGTTVNSGGGITWKVRKRATPTVSIFGANGTANRFNAQSSLGTDTNVGTLTLNVISSVGFAYETHTLSFGTEDVMLAHWVAEAEL